MFSLLSGFKERNCYSLHIVISVQPTLPTSGAALLRSLWNNHLSSLQPHSNEEGLQRRERHKNSEEGQVMKIKIRRIRVRFDS
jgi:hypothetical protein